LKRRERKGRSKPNTISYLALVAHDKRAVDLVDARGDDDVKTLPELCINDGCRVGGRRNVHLSNGSGKRFEGCLVRERKVFLFYRWK